MPAFAHSLRVYLRRSKGDDAQTHSLDVQREGCLRFAATLGPFTERFEYLDDDRAGDDFAGRAGLQRLLRDLVPGDVVVVRDQSRIGRDALETALVVRTIVQDRKARLIFYSTGEDVRFASAVDALMTVAKGAGAQMELENIRSRVAEALRARVRSGRLAGGRCFGYCNVQAPDPDGRRKNTRAVVDEAQAAVVRRIFAMYIQGAGLSKIAKALNADRIPAAFAGRRGSGSWAPSAIREIVRRERYRGVYVHGVIARKRQGGKRAATKADPATVIRIEVPEWRIVDEATWQAAQERISKWSQGGPRVYGPRCVYPLSGLARCASCGGAIVVGHTKIGTTRMQAYVCGWHWKRGSSVCDVSIRQPREDAERYFATILRDQYLTPALLADVAQEIRAEVKRQISDGTGDSKPLEDELAKLRGEQKRLAKAVALADGVEELVGELRQRNARIKALEADLAAARRAPQIADQMADQLETRALAWLERIREALIGDPATAREIYRTVFPDGVRMIADEDRRVWVVAGDLDLGALEKFEEPGTTKMVTPLGLEPRFST